MTHDERDHLRGIVALWLTNGNKPVDAGNETRYWSFPGGRMEAANAVETMICDGLLDAPLADDYVHDVSMVVPTARGIFEAFG